MTSTQAVLAETFGPTVQGEGPSCGRRAAFIRLSGCNLTCGFCDTGYTWNWRSYDKASHQRRTGVPELLTWAAAMPVQLFVITGGEPMIQAKALAELTSGLLDDDREVEIETNGTIPPPEGLLVDGVSFNVSPKLANSGVREHQRLRPDVLRHFADSGRARFKFVVADVDDLAEVAELETAFGLDPIWVMPEGVTEKATLTTMRALADDVIARGWNLTPRLHVLLWGDVCGR